MRGMFGHLACGATSVLLVTALSAVAVAAPVEALESSTAGPAGVVINEFAPRGWSSTDEFVELRNTSDQTVELDGWDLAVCVAPGLAPTLLAQFGSAHAIGPGGYLLGSHHDNLGSHPADFEYGVDVPEDGGWLLRDLFWGSDRVGLRSDLACTEGTRASRCDWAAGEAVTRDDRGTDTNNNAADFSCQPRTPGS